MQRMVLVGGIMYGKAAKRMELEYLLIATCPDVLVANPRYEIEKVRLSDLEAAQKVAIQNAQNIEVVGLHWNPFGELDIRKSMMWDYPIKYTYPKVYIDNSTTMVVLSRIMKDGATVGYRVVTPTKQIVIAPIDWIKENMSARKITAVNAIWDWDNQDFEPLEGSFLLEHRINGNVYAQPQVTVVAEESPSNQEAKELAKRLGIRNWTGAYTSNDFAKHMKSLQIGYSGNSEYLWGVTASTETIRIPEGVRRFDLSRYFSTEAKGREKVKYIHLPSTVEAIQIVMTPEMRATHLSNDIHIYFSDLKDHILLNGFGIDLGPEMNYHLTLHVPRNITSVQNIINYQRDKLAGHISIDIPPDNELTESLSSFNTECGIGGKISELFPKLKKIGDSFNNQRDTGVTRISNIGKIFGSFNNCVFGQLLIEGRTPIIEQSFRELKAEKIYINITGALSILSSFTSEEDTGMLGITSFAPNTMVARVFASFKIKGRLARRTTIDLTGICKATEIEDSYSLDLEATTKEEFINMPATSIKLPETVMAIKNSFNGHKIEKIEWNKAGTDIWGGFDRYDAEENWIIPPNISTFKLNSESNSKSKNKMITVGPELVRLYKSGNYSGTISFYGREELDDTILSGYGTVRGYKFDSDVRKIMAVRDSAVVDVVDMSECNITEMTPNMVGQNWKSIIMPKKAMKISAGAFSSWRAEGVGLGENVRSIESGAIRHMENLRFIYMGRYINEIHSDSIYQCGTAHTSQIEVFVIEGSIGAAVVKEALRSSRKIKITEVISTEEIPNYAKAILGLQTSNVYAGIAKFRMMGIYEKLLTGYGEKESDIYNYNLPDIYKLEKKILAGRKKNIKELTEEDTEGKYFEESQSHRVRLNTSKLIKFDYSHNDILLNFFNEEMRIKSYKEFMYMDVQPSEISRKFIGMINLVTLISHKNSHPLSENTIRKLNQPDSRVKNIRDAYPLYVDDKCGLYYYSYPLGEGEEPGVFVALMGKYIIYCGIADGNTALNRLTVMMAKSNNDDREHYRKWASRAADIEMRYRLISDLLEPGDVLLEQHDINGATKTYSIMSGIPLTIFLAHTVRTNLFYETIPIQTTVVHKKKKVKEGLDGMRVTKETVIRTLYSPYTGLLINIMEDKESQDKDNRFNNIAIIGVEKLGDSKETAKLIEKEYTSEKSDTFFTIMSEGEEGVERLKGAKGAYDPDNISCKEWRVAASLKMKDVRTMRDSDLYVRNLTMNDFEEMADTEFFKEVPEPTLERVEISLAEYERLDDGNFINRLYIIGGRTYRAGARVYCCSTEEIRTYNDRVRLEELKRLRCKCYELPKECSTFQQVVSKFTNLIGYNPDSIEDIVQIDNEMHPIEDFEEVGFRDFVVTETVNSDSEYSSYSKRVTLTVLVMVCRGNGKVYVAAHKGEKGQADEVALIAQFRAIDAALKALNTINPHGDKKGSLLLNDDEMFAIHEAIRMGQPMPKNDLEATRKLVMNNYPNGYIPQVNQELFAAMVKFRAR
jgi:hypothetical protein